MTFTTTSQNLVNSMPNSAARISVATIAQRFAVADGRTSVRMKDVRKAVTQTQRNMGRRLLPRG